MFKAYERWVEKHGKEKLLPTPYLSTWQQMYYVAQAQVGSLHPQQPASTYLHDSCLKYGC